MANNLDLVNLGIYLFVGLAMVANSLIAFFLWIGAVDLLVIAIILIFVSNAQLVATIGLWSFTGHTANKSRPALLLLGEIARRAEVLMTLSTPLFDFLEEVFAYRFQWSREERGEFLRAKLEDYQERLKRLEVPEERPPTGTTLGDWFERAAELFAGWRKEKPRPKVANPIRLNTIRGRRLE